MHQLIQSWLKTIKHYLTTSLQKGGVTVQGDVYTELNEITVIGGQIFDEILDRIGRLEATTPAPLFQRALVWTIYLDLPVAVEAFVAATDDTGKGGRGRFFILMPPPGGQRLLFESQLKGNGFFLNEQEALAICRDRVARQINQLEGIAETLADGWSADQIFDEVPEC